MSKAAIYCRLSEEDRSKKNKTDDSGSIQNQKAMLLEYAAQHSWEVYSIYSDDNYTGSDRSRPAFNRLLEDAESRTKVFHIGQAQEMGDHQNRPDLGEALIGPNFNHLIHNNQD